MLATCRRLSPRRLLFAAAGISCVALAGIGVVVPGMPTTVFLIVASYLLTKSCPYLEERLVRNRIFRPYLQFLDGTARMSRRAKVMALGLMWASVTISLWLLAAGDRLPPLGAAAIVIAASVGTWFIVRHGARVPAEA